MGWEGAQCRLRSHAHGASERLYDASDAFCLFYDAKEKTVKAFNGSGRAPKALTIEYARSQGVLGNSIPASNLNSVTVPGAAAAWVDTVEKFGSGKFTIADVLQPAIKLAEEG